MPRLRDLELLVAALACAACGGPGAGSTSTTTGSGSGAGVAAGSLTCAGVLGGGPTVTPARPGLVPADFATAAGSQAYANLQGCACAGGCTDVCDEPLDYCNGSVATGPCASCLKATCGQLLAACSLN